MNTERAFLPAAGHDLLLPLYDPLTRLLGFDGIRRMLLDQASLEPRHRVLDVGCGTGSLAVLIKQRYPTVDVVAVDPDPRALARAERKARRAGVTVRFDRGFADALGYADATFDRVLSSMMLHHLDARTKERALREARRVLRSGGRLEILDFSTADSGGQTPLSRLIHSDRQLKDNVQSRIVELLEAAGFIGAKKVGERTLIFGRVAFFQAAAPAPVVTLPRGS